jgi:hypothetical protein
MSVNQNITLLSGSVDFGIKNATTGAVTEIANAGLTTAFEITQDQTDKTLEGPDGTIYAQVYLKPKVSIKIDLRDMSPAVLAKALGGTLVTKTTGTITAQSLGSPAIGEVKYADGFNLSSAVITDSAASAATLVAGTDYTIDLDTGRIEFLTAVGARTAPYKLSATTGASAAVIALKNVGGRYQIRLTGENLNTGEKVVFEAYDVRMSLSKSLNLLGGDFLTATLEGKLVEDASRAADAEYGKFARYVVIS